MRNKYEDTLTPGGGHVTRYERVPNASDLSFAQVQFTYAGSQKERPPVYTYIAPPTSPARSAVRKEDIAYFILGRAPNPSSRPSP